MHQPPHLNFVLSSGAVDFLRPDIGDRRYCIIRTKPQRFRVSATRPDGHTTEYIAVGGHSSGHTVDAQDLAGLGGLVRVMRVDEAETT